MTRIDTANGIQLRRPVMRDNVPCEFPAGYDGTAVLERLAQVLDPELGESIVDLGFVRSLELHSGHADVALRLRHAPAHWCPIPTEHE